MAVKARFWVSETTDYRDNNGGATQQRVKLSAVYDPNPESPNHAFWSATPAGTIEMHITNKEAFQQFADGGLYEVTFEKVEKENAPA